MQKKAEYGINKEKSGVTHNFTKKVNTASNKKTMEKVNYFKLIAKENFHIDSPIEIYQVCEFIQNSGLYEAIRKAAGFSKGKAGIKQTNLIISCILAIIDGVSNIEQMPCFLEKNKRFAKELGINKIPSKSTIYRLFERVNKDNKFVKKLKDNMQNWLILNYSGYTKEIMKIIFHSSYE